MSNSRRPISAHFSRLSLNQKAKFIIGNNHNSTVQKPSTARSKYKNIWALNGTKIRSNEASDFSPIKVTSLQPSQKSKANRQNRPRPQTSNTLTSRRNNRNHKQNTVYESESNTQLLTYQHRALSGNHYNHSTKTQSKENRYRKNYKNTKHSYSSTSVGARYGINNNQRNSGMIIKSTQHSSRKNNEAGKDNVVFAIDPKYPLCPIVFRDEKTKTISRERLNLDNRNLTKCPILRGEENLRLLNYENNLITNISNLHNLKNLIFLDLYNNRIQNIENLHFIPMLRVLMLGRNEISTIENLDTLQCLDVLDLHSNKIIKMQNLNHLLELRVLNLASNQISHVENIHNLKNLVELNLRRNNIYKMNSFVTHQKLQRILLSNNNIRNIQQLVSLSFAKCVQQLTIDNNPFYDEQNTKTEANIYSNPYNVKIISMFKSLKHLNSFEVTEDIKQKVALRASGFVRLNEAHSSSQSVLKLKENNDNHADIEEFDETQDELLAQNKDLEEHIQKAEDTNGTNVSEITDISDDIPPKQSLMTEDELMTKIKEQWLSPSDKKNDELRHFKLDEEKKILKMYACGVPKMESDSLNQIEQLHFYYVHFNELTKYFNYLKTLKNVHVLKFNHNKIHSLYQIDALSVVGHIKNVSFGENEITKTSPTLYRLYCIFRLPNIEYIDGTKVTNDEKEIANEHFSLLREQWKNSKILVTRGFCAPNLNQIRNINEKEIVFYKNNIHEIFKMDENNSNSDHTEDMNTDELSELIKQENKAKQSIKHAINVYKSRQKIKTLWPMIVMDLIQNVIHDLQPTSA